MFEFQPSATALLAQWLTNYGLALGAGLIVGSIATASFFVVKVIKLMGQVPNLAGRG